MFYMFRILLKIGFNSSASKFRTFQLLSQLNELIDKDLDQSLLTDKLILRYLDQIQQFMARNQPIFDDLLQSKTNQPNQFRHLWIHKTLKIEKSTDFILLSKLTGRVIKTVRH